MKMQRKSCFLLALLLVCTIFLFACGGDSGGSAQPAGSGDAPSATGAGGAGDNASGDGDDKVIKIGVSVANLSDDFTVNLIKGCEQAMEELAGKVEFSILDGRADPTIQLNHVETFISQGMDAICMQPTEKDALTPAVQIANKAGVPVVLFNCETTGGEYTFVGSRDIEAGRLQGEWLAENAPENATFVYAMIVMGQSGQIDRKEGLFEILDAKRPDITMLAEQTSNGMRDQGMKLCEDWLQSSNGFDMYISQNDSAALGALEALNTAGKEAIVIGVDGIIEAVEKVANGELDMTIFQNAHGQAYTACITAYQIVTGALDPAETKEIIIPFEPVTIDNAAAYLERLG